ncbi:alpha-glucosidase family protein [Gayadomonas joobiniege]|uniref:alpha-glucosidase family protein n=1 Tax=Gayadomonas joobiniege TaxID=1234606 RepID=UPI00058B34E7|nr:alpha-glucosidase family protein [Gayadomonas joobiniege]
MAHAEQLNWWKGAVIYQVYPRSFQDSNQDGVGDLQGIIQRLDYIKSLAVDAIWISPFFKSPMKDFGYDISDYRAIDPLFGEMDDFDELIEKAHQKNIKIIIDQVLSHTSDEHPWFLQSREDKTNDKADWYVWADARPDGTQPNNWLSIFGGPAWQWEPRRGQYYLHNFLTGQPDLNFHNPEVREAVLGNVKYWLDKGVDGFRLDAINFCFHDKQLRDNPAKPPEKRTGRGFSEDNPYAFQYHFYNNTQPENLAFMREIRALLDQYPGTVSLGEISSEDSLTTMAEYTSGGDKLHMGYSFELLTKDYSVAYIRSTVEQLENSMTEGWPCWAFSNHDVERVASRWNPKGIVDPQQCKMLVALLTSLRGSTCLYQGEELGLGEAEVAFADLQDPYGITFWPNFKGRDGCRTPMPWQADETSLHAGFSQTKPWLPVDKNHQAQAVAKQDTCADSVLNANRTFLHWRQQQVALLEGDIKFIDTDEPILAFWRKHEEASLFCVFNLSEQPQTLNLAEFSQTPLTACQGYTDKPLMPSETSLTLPAYGYFIAQANH